jgi:hypothetical protein
MQFSLKLHLWLEQLLSWNGSVQMMIGMLLRSSCALQIDTCAHVMPYFAFESGLHLRLSREYGTCNICRRADVVEAAQATLQAQLTDSWSASYTQQASNHDPHTVGLQFARPGFHCRSGQSFAECYDSSVPWWVPDAMERAADIDAEAGINRTGDHEQEASSTSFTGSDPVVLQSVGHSVDGMDVLATSAMYDGSLWSRFLTSHRERVLSNQVCT